MLTEAMYHLGVPLEMNEETFGPLRESADIVGDGPSLRRRLVEDGYLYLPGYLDRELVLAARRWSMQELLDYGYLDPDSPLMDGVVHSQYRGLNVNPFFGPDLVSKARHNLPLQQVLYSGLMMDFYRCLFVEDVRPFDFTWQRAVTASQEAATSPHCDNVFMSRGSKRVCTSWMPLGDIPTEMGGLMVLEGSCHLEHVKSTYGTLDVDYYCTNYDDAAEIEAGTKQWQDWTNWGSYNNSAVETRQELGGRWLTTDYAAGDLLVFGMFTMHASMDNHTDRFRLSTDTRYQPATDPIDERWIGELPIRHGPEGKVGHIC